jgi:copper chaperone
MNTLKFKTNIKCSGCVARSTPFLNDAAGEGNWQVDVNDPSKILTVTAAQPLDPQQVIHAVKEAGYEAEKLD